MMTLVAEQYAHPDAKSVGAVAAVDRDPPGLVMADAA